MTATPRGIHHLALRVGDLERSVAFYSRIVGLPELSRKIEDGETTAVWLKAGDAVLMLERRLRGKGPETGSGHLLAFAFESLDLVEARLAKAGVPIDDRTGETLYVRDPDGHRVGFSRFRFGPPQKKRRSK
jgi:catechol 2,3-dioxygenase-like lactoylglutathione lyase family enzyme